MCIQVHMQTCICPHGAQKSTVGIILHELSTFFLETESLTGTWDFLLGLWLAR